MSICDFIYGFGEVFSCDALLLVQTGTRKVQQPTGRLTDVQALQLFVLPPTILLTPLVVSKTKIERKTETEETEETTEQAEEEKRKDGG